jgi:hypothetical protein
VKRIRQQKVEEGERMRKASFLHPLPWRDFVFNDHVFWPGSPGKGRTQKSPKAFIVPLLSSLRPARANSPGRGRCKG